MASLIASRYRLLVVLLAVVLVGCETSGPGSVDDNQQLNRWLEQGTDETPGAGTCSGTAKARCAGIADLRTRAAVVHL